ncbi:MAG: FAD-dependent oxidoreductase, partial [Candidatus Heimdallarchaeota archaeon]|nr:FAD-dependent oxidoreductase [Candidatus Heimdallarchaeota archaeon]
MGSEEQKRIYEHPILDEEDFEMVPFSFNGKQIFGKVGEMLSSALIANGIQIFGYHPKDDAPQGIFCANGQCAQCAVIVDGIAEKSCMMPLKQGMKVESVKGYPALPEDDEEVDFQPIETVETEVLIIGAGPAGLQAALTLGKLGAQVVLIDDKDRLGGKLLLQTHKFFGSEEDSYAGTRGINIAKILEEEVKLLSNIDIWLDSPCIGVFSDQLVGVLKGDHYLQVKPNKLLVATGAREKMLAFPGNTLPGVYGAGAFQTLVNRDLVKSSEKIFIIGGGNVGIIAGYHAIQAGIEVVGLVEALPKCGGYKVHEDKLRRLGVPIYTRHTVIAAHGKDHVDSVTISEINERFQPISGTDRTFEVDTVLIAIGLDPVNEFYHKAKEFCMDVWAAGDAYEIAEASSAMFSGKIAGMKIARSLGLTKEEVPKEWELKAELLKSHPGPVVKRDRPIKEEGVYPVFHCNQEIPCNPCASVCPKELIVIPEGGLLGLPEFQNQKETDCIGCAQCVAVCPGLAVTLVDYREDSSNPLVTIPTEIFIGKIEKGDELFVVGEDNVDLGKHTVEKVRVLKKYPNTQLVSVRLPKDVSLDAISFKQSKDLEVKEIQKYHDIIPDEAIICRCERITAGEIRALIKQGVTDANELKA